MNSNCPLVSVAVYCGAKVGDNPQYVQQAQLLGHHMVANGWGLVFGSGDAGIMGAVYHAVHHNQGYTIGVSPKFLADFEQHNTDFKEYYQTETMHERKRIMAEKASAFCILPGGVGTMDEFFEILTWRKLAIHAKPIVIVNIDGYWKPLVDLLDSMKRHGFLGADVIPNQITNPTDRPDKPIPDDYVVVDTVQEAVDYLQTVLP